MLNADMPVCARRQSAFLITLAATSLLAGCHWSGRIDPQELVAHAVRATQALDSVAFDLEGDIRVVTEAFTANGKVGARGAMSDGGRMIGGHAVFEGDFGRANGMKAIEIEGDFAYTALGSLDVRITEAEGETLAVLLAPSVQAAMINRWVRLAEGSTGSLVTPEPQILTAEAAALQVTEDFGPTQIDELVLEHYGIQLHPGKLRAYLTRAAEDRGQRLSAEEIEAQVSGLSAEGEVWIDPKTALVHRLEWNIEDTKEASYRVNLAIELSDHNAAEPSAKPEQSIPLPLAPPVALPSSSSSSLDTPDA